jgi:hypothetical protein
VFVLVSGSDGEARASVEDEGNLRQLHAEFRGVGDDAAAWLDAGALRAAGDGSEKWVAGFDEMLAYAAGKGWTSQDGARVRAHIVRS